MTTDTAAHRLEGLEPDNLLAFLALLGLLVTIEHARPAWRPRVRWSWDAPPVRPVLLLRDAVRPGELCNILAAGLDRLLHDLDFGPVSDIKTPRSELAELVAGFSSRTEPAFALDLIAALMADDPSVSRQEPCLPTPLSYPSVATSNFLRGLLSTARSPLPERRSRDPDYPQTAGDCVAQALFSVWRRNDRPVGLRWDYREVKRYAYQFAEPTKKPPTTQHGAYRLAIVGLSQLSTFTVVSANRVVSAVVGGQADGREFSFAWPLPQRPASLAAIRALLLRPDLRSPQGVQAAGVQVVMVSERLSSDRLWAFGPGRSVSKLDTVAGSES